MANPSLSACIAEIKANQEKFYVYILSRPDGSPFYVGCGAATVSRHAHRIADHELEAKRGKKSKKCSVIRKFGDCVAYSIESWHDSAEAMFFREVVLISAIGRYDLGRGPLANGNDGGTGQLSPSQEVRDAMSAAWTVERKARHSLLMKGRSVSAETIAKANASRKRKFAGDDAARIRRSENIRAIGRDPAIHEKRREKHAKTVSSEEYRAKRSQISKIMFSDERHRKRVSDFMKDRWSSDGEFRKTESERLKKMATSYWSNADDALRKKHAEAISKSWTPEKRIAQAKRMSEMRRRTVT